MAVVPDLVSIGPVHLPDGFEVTCLRPVVALKIRLSLGQDSSKPLCLARGQCVLLNSVYFLLFEA